MSRLQHSSLRKRRTTLSLPADALTEAERIARARNVNVSTVIEEALSEGLRLKTTAERSNEVLECYKKELLRFSDSEMAILDGVILEPTTRKQAMVDPASEHSFRPECGELVSPRQRSGATDWMRAYLSRHEAYVPAVTVMDRIVDLTVSGRRLVSAVI